MRASWVDLRHVHDCISTCTHTHDFEMESTTLTIDRSVGSRTCTHACESGREARSRSQRAERRKTQVTTGPPCSERNKIFLFPLHLRSFAHVYACSLRKRGNIWAYKIRSEPAAETASRIIVLFIC